VVFVFGRELEWKQQLVLCRRLQKSHSCFLGDVVTSCVRCLHSSLY
jgi:hypothetical protein